MRLMRLLEMVLLRLRRQRFNRRFKMREEVLEVEMAVEMEMAMKMLILQINLRRGLLVEGGLLVEVIAQLEGRLRRRARPGLLSATSRRSRRRMIQHGMVPG